MKLTGENTHIATALGAAKGGLVQPGQSVPAGIPVGSWMAEKPTPPKAKAKAAE